MKRAAWPLMFAVLVVSLLIGSWPQDSSDETAQARMARIAERIRCPTCAGLSVAESDSPLARSAREEIARRVDAGQSNEEVTAFFVSVYGEEALTAPKSSGFGALVWLLPAIAAIIALTLAWVALKRWRSGEAGSEPTDEERELVEAALRERT